MTLDRRKFLNTLAGTAAGSALLPSAACATPPAAWPPAGDVPDDRFWQIVRDQFPLTLERVYLNTGGLGPAPYPVLDAVHRTTMELQTISETGYARTEAARAPVAAFLGADPSEIAFTRNATEANAIVAAGLQLGEGDEVIFESHAHPGGSLPWLNMQKQRGVRVVLFEPDRERPEGNLERIRQAITPRTKVIQVSHITAPTGIIFDAPAIARLAHERGLWFHIDGAQSAGMIPVDLHAIGCDSYATSCHKWMCGPHGTGLLYVKHDRLDEVVPMHIGAYSDARHTLPDELEYFDGARRYEYGTRDAAEIEGVVAAVRFHERIGVDRVHQYGKRLATFLQENFREMEGVEVLTPSHPEMYGSMTTIRLDAVPYDVLNRYFTEEHRLRARIVTEQDINALRISTHVFNSLEECERIVEAVDSARRGL